MDNGSTEPAQHVATDVPGGAAHVRYMPVSGLGEIREGDDLVGKIIAALADQALALTDHDVLVVTQKIVSKADGRTLPLHGIIPSVRALQLSQACGKEPRLVEAILRESTAVIRVAPNLLITRHRLGFVMANAGIDQSNVPGEDTLLLLPEDPDARASDIRQAIAARTGQRVGIIISDSWGRPWREGVVGMAIGAAGVPSLIDHRGTSDRQGRRLQVTQVAWADAAAAAAGLIMGEADEGIPAVCIRGLKWNASERAARCLVRPPQQDLFS